MRNLLLLRHAKSDWSTGHADFDRPLVERGRKNAGQLGLWLQSQKRLPDYIVSSPAMRARQTLALVIEPLVLAPEIIHYDDAIYAAGLRDLFGVLAGIPEQFGRVMLVGHNPGFDQLLSYLADVDHLLTNDGKLMTTCALAELTLPDDWGDLLSGCAEPVNLIRSKDLI